MNAQSLGNSFRSRVLRGEKPELVVADKNRRHGREDSLDADLISRSEFRNSNHRLKDRHRLSEEKATILYAGRIIPVEVINLSAGGAMIRGAFEPKLWDIVDLQLGDGFTVEAAVRWLKGDQLGLEFAHETRIECEREERDALLLDVIRRSFDNQDIHFATEDDFGPEPAASPHDGACHRDEKRHPLIWVGEIHHAHDSHPARLRNVSEGGALIDVAADYPIGSEVMLDLGDAGQFFGSVVWTGADQVGLRFTEPFDVACLAKARPRVLPANWQAPTFLNDGDDSESAWNENWSRSSLDEMRIELEGYLKR